MKFTALLVSSISALSFAKPRYTPPPGYYYNANQIDSIINANVDIKAELGIDLDLFKKTCTRGNYGSYDSYRCTTKLAPKLDIYLNLDLNIGLGLNLAGLHL